MNCVNPHRSQVRRLAWQLVALVMVLAVSAGPAAAQYGGGGVQVFVDPTRVPVDQTFDVFGRDCPAGATVEITIDGVPGVLATGVASGGGFYTVEDVVLPDGLLAGSDYDVRATCGAQTGTALITLVCPSGDDPVAGECEDGSDGVVGGQGPTTTTTAAPTTTGGSGGTTGGETPGNSGDTGGSSPDLAFTGAAFTGIILQAGVTLLASGFFLLIWASRRRDGRTAI